VPPVKEPRLRRAGLALARGSRGEAGMWWRVVSTLFLTLMAVRGFAVGQVGVGLFFAVLALGGLLLLVLRLRGVELPRPER
jgi:hypothetical protein